MASWKRPDWGGGGGRWDRVVGLKKMVTLSQQQKYGDSFVISHPMQVGPNATPPQHVPNIVPPTTHPLSTHLRRRHHCSTT